MKYEQKKQKMVVAIQRLVDAAREVVAVEQDVNRKPRNTSKATSMSKGSAHAE